MKISFYLVCFALLCCVAVVLGSATPGEKDDNSVAYSDPNLPASSSDEKPASGNPGDKPEDSDSNEQTSNDGSDDITICVMNVIQCSNDTYSTQNQYCEYICGAAPIGGLTWAQTYNIQEQFEDFYYNYIAYSYIGDMQNRTDVHLQTPPESYTDYCIEVVTITDATSMPDVYNGVRVFYSQAAHPTCTRVCPDGSVMGCLSQCADDFEASSAGFFVSPIWLIMGVVLFSTCCCCCIRRRRNCRAKRCAGAVQMDATKSQMSEAYPADQMALLQQQQEYEILQQQQQYEQYDLTPYTMEQQPYSEMMYPPMMPPVPPHMMMPNGTYPIMVQGPDGMWYPVIPHPEDA